MAKAGFQLRFQMYGPWKEVEKELKKLPYDLKTSFEWGQRKVAQKYIKIVKAHLVNQDLNWTPLQPSTVDKKGGNEDILIDTETYLDNIKTWQEQGKRMVGIKKGITYERKSGSIEVARVAAIHEAKSYSGGPYRALWNPSFEEMGGLKGVRQEVMQVLFNKMVKLQSKGFTVTKT